MFNNEHDFINHIIDILKREGYQIEKEIRVPEGYRVDIKAFKETETFGIEVKFEKRGISDDISKSYKLHQLPEFDRVYVAAPKILISDDHIAFARNLKVGILGVDHDSIIRVSESDKLKSAELQSGASLPKQMITPGKSFVVSKTVRNLGEKVIRHLEMYYSVGGPFIGARKQRKKELRLLPNETWECEFNVQVRKTVKSGKYPLLLTCIGENVERSDTIIEIRIQEENEKK